MMYEYGACYVYNGTKNSVNKIINYEYYSL